MLISAFRLFSKHPDSILCRIPIAQILHHFKANPPLFIEFFYCYQMADQLFFSHWLLTNCQYYYQNVSHCLLKNRNHQIVQSRFSYIKAVLILESLFYLVPSMMNFSSYLSVFRDQQTNRQLSQLISHSKHQTPLYEIYAKYLL